MDELSIAALEIVEYDERGYHWESREILGPSWAEVEQSIRQLDRYRRPFIYLRRYEDTHESDYLSILGGDGAYSLNGTLGGDEFLSYYDDALGSEEIPIWTSDQGYYPAEKYVCYQLETVLKIARYFAEHGQFDPSVDWRQ